MYKEFWQGRFDGDDTQDLRFWQIINPYKDEKTSGVCFIGYNTDEGIRRNKGRVGASQGSNSIRWTMQSLPIIPDVNLYDYGNLENTEITEDAQQEFATKVYNVLKNNMMPIGLGGGHDIAFASYMGIRQIYPQKRIGIINFDAHLDMREYEDKRTSGSSFKEILDKDANVNYAIIGFREYANTMRLINYAKAHNVLFLFGYEESSFIMRKLSKFMSNVDIVYLSFCMDVFDASQAPGVSAPTMAGLMSWQGKNLLKFILDSGKVISVDFAEVNPKYDQDHRTARLAGVLAYECIKSKKNI